MDGKSEKGRRNHGEGLATLPPDQSTEAWLPHSPSTGALLRDWPLYLGRSLLSQVGRKSSYESYLSRSASEWSCSPAPWVAMRWYRLSMSVWYGQKQWRWDKTRMEMATFDAWFIFCFSFVFFSVLMELSGPRPQHCALCTKAHKCFQRSTMPGEHPSVGKVRAHTQQGATQWTISGREFSKRSSGRWEKGRDWPEKFPFLKFLFSTD